MSNTSASDGYEAKSRAFLEQARRELEQGDRVQASEKLWGAAAQMVKGAAEKRGWPHKTHRDLFLTVNRLAAETQDREFATLFVIANGLHVNFYEHDLPIETVQLAVPDIERLIDKLAAL